MRHALSVDLEDWYHDPDCDPGHAGRRVERNTDRLLDIFADTQTRATFFILGDVAEQHPSLIRRIAAAGHEIGSHSYRHKRVLELTRHEFRDHVRRSVAVLGDRTGQAKFGFRAPYFSIKADVRWPIDILAECGIRYDASILPIDRPPGLEVVTARHPYRLHNGMWEVPVAVPRIAGVWHLPVVSGTGLRLFSVARQLAWLRSFEQQVGPAVFYLHPWEIDPASPTGPGPGRWILRVGRRGLEDRLRELLRHVEFGRIDSVFTVD